MRFPITIFCRGNTGDHRSLDLSDKPIHWIEHGEMVVDQFGDARLFRESGAEFAVNIGLRTAEWVRVDTYYCWLLGNEFDTNRYQVFLGTRNIHGEVIDVADIGTQIGTGRLVVEGGELSLKK